MTVVLKDANGNTFDVEVAVNVVDDRPTISADVSSTTVRPSSGAENLEDGQKAEFTEKSMAGQPIEQGSHLEGWDGVTIYAGKVTYEKDEDGNYSVIHELDTNAQGYGLKYSTYPNEGNKESDWGLMVSSPNDTQQWEINVSADGQTSEAVVFDLGGKLAYGVSIDFGAFYLGGEEAEWDHVSERALVTFYRDGRIVGSTEVHGKSEDGTYTLDSSDVVLGGFDKVVISSLDNSTLEHPDENSDFTIQGIDFITKRDDPVSISEGTVTAESGADGFAEEYKETNVRFDLEGMVQEDTLNEEGTSGTITVQIDGVKQNVTLELSEGASGESILTGTIEGSNEQLFTATLDQDGHWTMEHYEQFQVQVPGEDGGWSNNFELAFKTEDADGDIATTTVDVPLEVKEQTTSGEDSPIGNNDDTITITGNEGDGVAGTVVAGDTGGMDVITNVQPGQNYNISIMLDLSGSMNDPSGSGMSRLAMAKEALETFINETIAKHDGAINLQIVTFNKNASEIGTWELKSGTTEGAEAHNSQQITNIITTLNNISYASGGTNYTAAMEKATTWFSTPPSSGGVAGNGGENLAFFISDGQPTYYNDQDWLGRDYVAGNGSNSTQETVKHTLLAAQELQNAGGGVQVNAIGIGTSESLDLYPQTILDLIDNTGGSMEVQQEYPYEENRGRWYDWTTAEWKGDKNLILGDSDLVDSRDDLTAALTGGSVTTSTDLADAGNDTITAEDSNSSAIVFGDVMNTDQLLHDLNDAQLSGAATLPDYGSGKEVFQWLETNGSYLQGTQFDGWTHDDSIKYMLQHAEELGCETRVDGNGTTYLVTVNGTVLNLDGSEADVHLETLTGRDGGNDIITGSSASDTIYGQEGNDLLIGDALSDNLSDLKEVTVSAIKEMETNDDTFESFLSRVEGTEGDGDDMLFGGTGDDVLIGMGGDDYLHGGHGEDAIFGGTGDDIVVYDPKDFLVDGGQGIDFMVSDNENLSLQNILDNKNTNEGPLVNNIDVLITGKDALSLTSIEQLAADYGIKLGTDDQGQETLSLDDRWQQDGDSGTFTFTGGADLKLETVLQSVDTSSHESGDTAQHVFILNNANG